MGKSKIECYVVGPVQTNCYFVINTETMEAIVIDPGASAAGLKKKLDEDGARCVAILLTHGHFDHAGGAAELAKLCDCKIYASKLEEDTLGNPSINMSAGMLGRPEKYKADIFLQDEEEVNLAGFQIRMLSTPGHTPGGCAYYLPGEMVVFSGDSLFCGSVGRTDFPGGSMQQLISSVRSKLLVLPDFTRVYPGHDSETSIADEKVYNPYLS